MNYYKRIKNICEDTSEELNCDIIYDNTMTAYTGASSTEIDTTQKPYIVIGTSEYKNPINWSRKNLFTASLVTLFHEKRHIEQMKDIKTKPIDEIAISQIAAQDNKCYYNSTMYKSLLFEIDAEQTGVLQAYKYLKSSAKKLKTDPLECIKTYINERQKMNDARYCTHEFDNINTIEDVNNAFNIVYGKALNAELDRRNFVPSLRKIKQYPDEQRHKFYPHNLIYEQLIEHENAESIMQMLPSGEEQTKFVASFVLYKHPEYRNYIHNNGNNIPQFEAYDTAYQVVNTPENLWLTRKEKAEKFNAALKAAQSKRQSRMTNLLDETQTDYDL